MYRFGWAAALSAVIFVILSVYAQVFLKKTRAAEAVYYCGHAAKRYGERAASLQCDLEIEWRERWDIPNPNARGSRLVEAGSGGLRMLDSELVRENDRGFWVDVR